MSATTPVHTHSAGQALSFGGVLRSEWIKLSTLRSTVWCYAIIVVLTVGFGLLLAATFSSGQALDTAGQQAYWVQVATLGIGFSQLVVTVLGALVITGEYGTGMIRSTLAAVPRRTPALIAKAVVFGLATFVVGFISLAGTALVAAPLLPSRSIEPDFGDPAVWLALLGGAGYLALIGVLALALGAIIRNSAGGIAAALGLILVLPTVITIFAGVTRAEWVQNLGTFLPSSAGSLMYSYTGSGQPSGGIPPTDGIIILEPWQGLVVLAAWVVVLFGTAVVLLKRRDV